jgi:DNA-binding NtrC family response regulator
LGNQPPTGFAAAGKYTTLREAAAESEARHIEAVLEYTAGDKNDAARVFGLTRENLWEKMRDYGIEDGRGESRGHSLPPPPPAEYAPSRRGSRVPDPARGES